MGRRQTPLSRQPRLLEIISLFLQHQAKGWPPPTVRDIVVQTDITSTSVVAYYFQLLVKEKIFEKIQTPSSSTKKTVLANRGWIDYKILHSTNIIHLVQNETYRPINNNSNQWKLEYNE